MDKICPIRSCDIVMKVACVKEKCQWWDGDNCAIATIAKNTNVMQFSLREIAEFMGDLGHR